MLSKRYRRNTHDGAKDPSWAEYCNNIGSSKGVANEGLKQTRDPDPGIHKSNLIFFNN
jgi:hypothetical protein